MPQTLEEMKNTDIRTVDPAQLVNASEVAVDMELPKDKRMQEMLHQIKNPYCFLSGTVVVKVNYADTSVSVDERFESYLRTL